MTTTKETQWLCPICGLCEFKYGEGCPQWAKDQCENAQYAHSTGRWFNREREVKESKGLGISEISGE